MTPKADSDTTVFTDGQAKFIFDLTPTHKLTASSFFGTLRDDDKPDAPRPLGRNSPTGTRAFSLAAIAGWDWTVRPNLIVQTKLFHLETNLRLLNFERRPLFRQPRRQWGVRQDWNLALGRHQIGWGTYLRRVEGEGFAQFFSGILQGRAELVENYRGRTDEKNFYAQDTYRIPSAHLALTAGVRSEQNSLTGETVVDPRLALAWGSTEAWQVRAGYGRHHQFPEMSTLLSLSGNGGSGLKSLIKTRSRWTVRWALEAASAWSYSSGGISGRSSRWMNPVSSTASWRPMDGLSTP